MTFGITALSLPRRSRAAKGPNAATLEEQLPGNLHASEKRPRLQQWPLEAVVGHEPYSE